MDIVQAKIIELTMELELRAKEYNILSEKLELIKRKNINPNDKRLEWIKEKFIKNYSQIIQINYELKRIKANKMLGEKK